MKNVRTDVQAVIQLLDDWELSPAEIISLLGLKGVSPRRIDQYRSGAETFAIDELMNKKLEHIVGIAKALDTAFPKNKKMPKVWLNTPHRRLSNKTPLEKIVSDGINGLIWVRSELDCAFAWQRNQEQQQK